MLPPDSLIRSGVTELPCFGDGRQSGTCGTPAILNASPESAAGGGLAILRTGDTVNVNLNTRLVNADISDAEIKARWEAHVPAIPDHQTPWQEMYRGAVGQLSTGGCLEFATQYHGVAANTPRHSH